MLCVEKKWSYYNTKKNLIENIGFDMNATNTIDNKKIYKKASELKLKKKLNFKISISPLKENDKYVFDNHFKGKYSFGHGS